VIENVQTAPLMDAIRLCGSSFGLPIRRHRIFESNVLLLGKSCQHRMHNGSYWTSFRPNGEVRRSSVVQVYGAAGETNQWPAAMGIDWMTTAELAQSIPPAYTQFIGDQLMAVLSRRDAA
jgi:DNA (cytosine-5)-methyltransferase 1